MDNLLILFIIILGVTSFLFAVDFLSGDLMGITDKIKSRGEKTKKREFLFPCVKCKNDIVYFWGKNYTVSAKSDTCPHCGNTDVIKDGNTAAAIALCLIGGK